MIPPSPASSSYQEVVYPIEIPALGECKSFLEAVKVIDEDPRIVSCLQFVDSLMYCCEVYGDIRDVFDIDKLSPEICDAITSVMDKIRRQTSRGLFGLSDTFIGQFHTGSKYYYRMKKFLEQYMIGKLENQHAEVNCLVLCEGASQSSIEFPFMHSKHVFIKLNNVCCLEKPKYTLCKVAIKVSVTLKNNLSFPVVTLTLVTDRELSEADTGSETPHFHQDPEFLQNIIIRIFYRLKKEDMDYHHLTLCKNRNSPTDALRKSYTFFMKRGCSFCIELRSNN
eukprot:sb/3467880/